MKYRRLGNSGLRVSEVALGTWLTFGNAVEDATARVCVEAAFDHGINFFDTADVYAEGEAERVLGQALRKFSRSDLVLATKCYFPMSAGPNDRGLSRKHVVESVHASLRRLGTDYIDLFQCHRFDETTPVEETVRTMEDLIRAGKMLYWGVSQWSAAQIADLVKLTDRLAVCRPVSDQPPYNMLSRSIEADVMPVCRDNGLGLVVYSPLAQGMLTGKYASVESLPQASRAADDRQNQFMARVLTPENVHRCQRIASLADQLDVKPAVLALAWCLRRPEVSSVICGASHPDQVAENASSSGLEIPPDIQQAIELILAG